MIKNNSSYLFYIFRLLIVFAVLYFLNVAVIGLSTKGGYYSPFVATYLDYISVLRSLLLHGAMFLSNALGYHTHVSGTYFLKTDSGFGVRMVYQCIGYGIMSFWAAFVIANRGSFRRKVVWILLGWLLIIMINIVRISLLLISLLNHKRLMFNIDHHTFFNIIAYLLVIFLIFIYDKRQGAVTV